VAVIDTGVAYDHPDLVNSLWDGSACKSDTNAVLGGCQHGYDFENNDKIPLPSSDSHGTHIAGTIAAQMNNGIGIAGVAPQTKIMAIRSSLTTANIIMGMNFAKNNGAKIINASWGSENPAFANDALLFNAIRDFPGIFITAAGNGGDDGDGDDNESTPFYPSNYTLPNIISVAATDDDDDLSGFSNYGSTSVDVGAPGVSIFSTIIGDNYGYMSGTSMATPHVAGVAGLLW
jgi:subtilisin family serine protease